MIYTACLLVIVTGYSDGVFFCLDGLALKSNNSEF